MVSYGSAISLSVSLIILFGSAMVRISDGVRRECGPENWRGSRQVVDQAAKPEGLTRFARGAVRGEGVCGGA
jgi:hypothetical protein